MRTPNKLKTKFKKNSFPTTTMSNSTTPIPTKVDGAKLAEVKVQLAVLEVSLLTCKEQMQQEQEELERDRQEAQEHREEAEQGFEADVEEQREKAPLLLDMEAVWAGLTRSSHKGRKSPESDDNHSTSSVATAVPRGDKPVMVIRGPVALAAGEVANSLGKCKERESGDGVSLFYLSVGPCG